MMMLTFKSGAARFSSDPSLRDGSHDCRAGSEVKVNE